MTAREIEYLSVGDIVGMHDLILETMGEPYAPLRDIGVLQGAIARPRNAAYYTEADLVRQACILMVAIAEAQPFLEGNKRAGMVSGLAFLERNGYQFVGDDILLAVLLVGARRGGAGCRRHRHLDPPLPRSLANKRDQSLAPLPSQTFRVLKARELKRHGEYQTGRLVLAAWDQQG